MGLWKETIVLLAFSVRLPPQPSGARVGNVVVGAVVVAGTLVDACGETSSVAVKFNLNPWLQGVIKWTVTWQVKTIILLRILHVGT